MKRYTVLRAPAYGPPHYPPTRTVEVPEEEVDYCYDGAFAPVDPLRRIAERVFWWGQNDVNPLPCPSVSVGDVIMIDGKGFTVEAFGFREV